MQAVLCAYDGGGAIPSFSAVIISSVIIKQCYSKYIRTFMYASTRQTDRQMEVLMLNVPGSLWI